MGVLVLVLVVIPKDLVFDIERALKNREEKDCFNFDCFIPTTCLLKISDLNFNETKLNLGLTLSAVIIRLYLAFSVSIQNF